MKTPEEIINQAEIIASSNIASLDPRISEEAMELNRICRKLARMCRKRGKALEGLRDVGADFFREFPASHHSICDNALAFTGEDEADG